MGFSAGGTYVSGVQQTEQGVLYITSSSTTLSVAGGETNEVTFTVPAGKKWTIKSTSTSVGSFVGTMSRIRHQIYQGASNLANLYDASGTTTVSLLNYPQPITLSAGSSIKLIITTSAWTSGQLTCYIVVQEANA